MPPKRAASQANTLKREADSPVLRRSARKRARVEPAAVGDDESELSELDKEDEDEFKPEEKPSTSSLGKFAYSGSSRPKRTPAKVQVKLEEMDDITLQPKASSSTKKGSTSTKDEVTTAAVENLRQVLPGGLTVDSILAAETSVVANAIRKVGFWQRKAEYIRAAAKILKEKHDSDVPKTVEELCALPGVGPKMSFLALQVAWNIQGLCPSANTKATGKGKKPIVYKAKADLDADGLIRLEDIKLEDAQDVKPEGSVVNVTNEAKGEKQNTGEPLVQIKIEE
ncbi:DNA N-glycosylase and apurinic/apyrimidinic (AP) lyase [Ceratobasidium sp. 423]|nr:DNA N-glycosylase and apurinic/apyrimidinic (AP) lyase [Ceratobasidium sp. 423]